jgi:hypothetical protein
VVAQRVHGLAAEARLGWRVVHGANYRSDLPRRSREAAKAGRSERSGRSRSP